jgi:hypothetical protein
VLVGFEFMWKSKGTLGRTLLLLLLPSQHACCIVPV